ncbi:hypothetical protein VP1G_08129 [Cytospora mali]|uniref:Rhodopsin domain-containing protein n=1 Tax=Cytospora mali TaxID=578113 RepID=A0A194VB06_CYTMA|nr:hypothetical protein VP1G_08129 [Valsa mali var. pyri (nom. inval.)]
MPSEAQEFINEVWGLQGVAYLVLGLRYYARLVTLGWRKFALDDLMIAIATVVHTAESVAAYYVVAYWKGLANNGMTDEQRATLDPNSEEWRLRVNDHCMPAISSIQTVFVMVMNIVTDIYLMAIPVPMVWKSGLPWRKKVSLTLMFSGGFLEMAFGALRCVSILTVGDRDPAQSGYWSVRESFVSFVLTNMPMLYPLFRNFFEKVSSSITLSNTNGGTGGVPSNGQAYRLGSYPDGPSKIRNKDPNPLPEDTRFGSDEHIIITCNDDSRATSIVQDKSETEVGTDQRQGQSPVWHGTSHAQVFPGQGHNEHQRSLSNSRATGGILVTTDVVVSEAHQQHRANRGGDAYLEV